MTNNQKLKGLAVVFFVIIVVLVALLVYATKIYTGNESASDVTAPVTDTASESSPSAEQASESSPAVETMELKLFNYDADDYDNPKEIVTIKVDKKLYEQDITAAINEVLKSTGLSINKAAADGDLMTVDLTKEIAAKFNMGSAGGITYTNTLVSTLINLPNINILQITVDGVSNIEGDHFSFNGTFTKSAEGKKYEFTSSGRQGEIISFN